MLEPVCCTAFGFLRVHVCPSASLVNAWVGISGQHTQPSLFPLEVSCCAHHKQTNTPCTGEYAERIDNADELLETFLETFPEETSMVRCVVVLGGGCMCVRDCGLSWCCVVEYLRAALHSTADAGNGCVHVRMCLCAPHLFLARASCTPPLPTQVQLQLLTATVKLFLKKPTENVQRMIQLVLSCATNETDNPDLRDRAYVYWRLLSTDPEVGYVWWGGLQVVGCCVMCGARDVVCGRAKAVCLQVVS